MGDNTIYRLYTISLKRKDFFNNLILVLFCLSVYPKVLGLNFLIQWDDQWVVINNFTEQGFTQSNLTQIFFEYYHGQYSPVNQVYYTLLYQINGYDPMIFHLGNLLLHCLNVLLIYQFVREILLKIIPQRTDQGQIAFLSAILFAVHPLNTESVAWLSASKIPLYAFFYLLGLLSYMRFVSYRRWQDYLYTTLFFIISFGAKEQAVTFPIALILIDFIIYKRDDYIQITLEKLIFLMLSIFFGILTIFSQGNFDENISNTNSYSILHRTILSSFAFVEYLTKSIFPYKLSYLYPFPFHYQSDVPVLLYLYPPLLCLAFYFLLRVFKKPIFLFCLLFFLIHLILTLHLVNLSRFAIIADRYAYLALISPVILISILCIDLQKKIFRTFKSPNIFFIALISHFAIVAFKRTHVWRDSETLKKDFIEIIKHRDDFKKKSF